MDSLSLVIAWHLWKQLDLKTIAFQAANLSVILEKVWHPNCVGLKPVVKEV